MALQPFQRYRPNDNAIKVPDGEGGFTIGLGDPHTVWGTITINETETILTCDVREPIMPQDILQMTDLTNNEPAVYRVVRITREPGARFHRASLQRMTRPIEPAQAGGAS